MHMAFIIAGHFPRGVDLPGDGRLQGSESRVQGSGFRVQGSGFRVQRPGFRVQGSESRVQGSGFRVKVRKVAVVVGLRPRHEVRV